MTRFQYHEMSHSSRQRLHTLFSLKFHLITLGPWALVYFLLGSCIDRYGKASEAYHETIVIQGLITDEPGPYEVVVSKTIPITSQAFSQTIVPRGISGALVTITDDEGYSEQLSEKSMGYYYTKTFQGVVGHSYHLTVTTPDGDTYKSSVQKILPVGDFDYYYQFRQVDDTLGYNLQLTSKNGFHIYINSKLDTGQEGRVWWRTIGTYHVLTVPLARTKWVSIGRPPETVLVSDPPRCVNDGYHYACTCCDCWIGEFTKKPLLSDPRFIANGEIHDLEIGFVEANKRTMYDKYVFEIQQLSVSKDVYTFWKLVEINDSNASNLFQTPAPRTIGTFTPQNPSAKPVMGYFAASAIKKRYITFTRKDVPYRIINIDFITDSCLEVFHNSTNKKPAFW